MNAIEELQQESYTKLVSAILEEEDFAKLPNSHPARAYKSLAHRISISKMGNTDVAMLDGRRFIVPNTAIKAITKELHRAHSGVEKNIQNCHAALLLAGYEKFHQTNDRQLQSLQRGQTDTSQANSKDQATFVSAISYE